MHGVRVGKSAVTERNWKEARMPEAQQSKGKMEEEEDGQPGRGRTEQSLWGHRKGNKSVNRLQGPV